MTSIEVSLYFLSRYFLLAVGSIPFFRGFLDPCIDVWLCVGSHRHHLFGGMILWCHLPVPHNTLIVLFWTLLLVIQKFHRACNYCGNTVIKTITSVGVIYYTHCHFPLMYSWNGQWVHLLYVTTDWQQNHILFLSEWWVQNWKLNDGLDIFRKAVKLVSHRAIGNLVVNEFTAGIINSVEMMLSGKVSNVSGRWHFWYQHNQGIYILWNCFLLHP